MQFGYLALRLRERWPAWKAVAAVSALGMSLPPWYEELAAPAKAWYYPPSAVMLSHTPLWIIFTYGGCMFSIGTATLLNYSPGAWGRAVIGGFLTGMGFMLSGIVCFAGSSIHSLGASSRAAAITSATAIPSVKSIRARTRSRKWEHLAERSLFSNSLRPIDN